MEQRNDLAIIRIGGLLSRSFEFVAAVARKAEVIAG